MATNWTSIDVTRCGNGVRLVAAEAGHRVVGIGA